MAEAASPLSTDLLTDFIDSFGTVNQSAYDFTISGSSAVEDIAEDGVWVADFGLAQVDDGAALTMEGEVLGTWRYMSPEQLMGGRVIVDSLTDIYSLGVTLYELLCLQPARDGSPPT